MNPRFWKWIFIGLAFGVCLELVKKPLSFTGTRLAGFAKFDDLLDEGKPVYVKGTNNEFKAPARQLLSSPRPEADTDLKSDHMPAAETDQQQPKPAPSPQPTPVDPKKAKAEADKKKAAEKKKREQEKKKKEEEEARQKQEAEEQAEAERARIEEEERISRESSDSNGQVITTVLFVPTPTPTPSHASGSTGAVKVPQTAAEWESLLLNTPNAPRTLDLLRNCQSGRVKADVCVQVFQKMAANSNAAIRKLGVMAADKFPQSQIFIMLAHVVQTEVEAEIKTLAENAANKYSLSTQVQHLQGVIHESTEPQITFEAIRLLKESMDTHLRGNVGSSGPGQQPNNPTIASLKKTYSPFVSVLQSFTQRSQDQQLNQNALQVLNELQTLLAALSS